MRITTLLLLPVLLAGCGSLPPTPGAVSNGLGGSGLCASKAPDCLTIYTVDVAMDPRVPVLARAEAQSLQSYQIADEVVRLMFEQLAPGERRLPAYSGYVLGYACIYKPSSGINRVAYYGNPGGGQRRRYAPTFVDPGPICPPGPAIGVAAYAIKMERQGTHGVLAIPRSLVGPQTAILLCEPPGTPSVVPGTGRGTWLTSQMLNWYLSQPGVTYLKTVVVKG